MNRLGRTIMGIVKTWKVWSAGLVCRELDEHSEERGIAAKLDEMADQGAFRRREQEEGPTIYYHKGHRHED